MAAAQPPLQIGALPFKYVHNTLQFEFQKLQAKGSVSDVYRATVSDIAAPQQKRNIAIKVLNETTSCAREINMHAWIKKHTKLPCPYLVHCEYVLPGIGPNLYAVVYQFLPYDLFDLLRKKTLTIPELSRMIQQVMTALVYLRNAKIVHGDVSLGNILWGKHSHTGELTFKLADLGNGHTLVKGDEPEQGEVYTRPWAPIERYLNPKSVDFTSDAFALACIVGQILKNNGETIISVGSFADGPLSRVRHVQNLILHLGFPSDDEAAIAVDQIVPYIKLVDGKYELTYPKPKPANFISWKADIIAAYTAQGKDPKDIEHILEWMEGILQHRSKRWDADKIIFETEKRFGPIGPKAP